MGERLNRHEQAQFAFEGFIENVGAAALRQVLSNVDERIRRNADPASFDFVDEGDNDPDTPFVTTITADATRVNLLFGMDGVAHSLDRGEVEVMIEAQELAQRAVESNPQTPAQLPHSA